MPAGRPPLPPLTLPAGLLRQYTAGVLSANALAGAVGADRARVRRALARLGLLRDRSAAMTALNARRWGQRRRTMLAQRAAGWSYGRIGRAHGVTAERARQVCADPQQHRHNKDRRP